MVHMWTGGWGVAVNPVSCLRSVEPRLRVLKSAHDEKVAEIYKASPGSQEKEKIKLESIKRAPITGLL